MGFWDWFKKPEPDYEEYFENVEASLLIYADTFKKFIEGDRWTIINIEDEEERCDIDIERVLCHWEVMLYEYPSDTSPTEALADWGIDFPARWLVSEFECGEYVVFKVRSQDEPMICKFVHDVYKKIFEYGDEPYRVSIGVIK